MGKPINGVAPGNALTVMQRRELETLLRNMRRVAGYNLIAKCIDRHPDAVVQDVYEIALQCAGFLARRQTAIYEAMAKDILDSVRPHEGALH